MIAIVNVSAKIPHSVNFVNTKSYVIATIKESHLGINLMVVNVNVRNSHMGPIVNLSKCVIVRIKGCHKRMGICLMIIAIANASNLHMESFANTKNLVYVKIMV